MGVHRTCRRAGEIKKTPHLKNATAFLRAQALKTITASDTAPACKQRHTLTAVGESPADDTSAPPHVISFERPEKVSQSRSVTFN